VGIEELVSPARGYLVGEDPIVVHWKGIFDYSFVSATSLRFTILGFSLE
jgi:hypothetical protein